MNIRAYVATLTLVGAFAFAPVAFAGNDNNNPPCQRNCGTSNGGSDGVSVDIDADIDNHNSNWAQGGAGGSATNANNNNATNNNNVIVGGGTAVNANTNNANNSSNATGGAGGAGGAGGSGGLGGTGGTANNNNVNSADNSSNATGGNATGGNATGGSSSADNNGNNNGNNNSSSTNSNDQSQSQSSNNENDNSNSNNASQSVNTYNQRDPVSTAYAAPLAVGEDTCMGSSSMGAQAVSFGISIGTTWQDANCQRLKNSRQLVALGYQRAATALMCVDDNVRHAMEEAGTPCPSGGAQPVAAIVAPPTPAPVVVQEAPVAAVAAPARRTPHRRSRPRPRDEEK